MSGGSTRQQLCELAVALACDCTTLWESQQVVRQHCALNTYKPLTCTLLLLQRRQYGPDLEEDDPSWIRVGRLTDFKVCKAGCSPCMHIAACIHEYLYMPCLSAQAWSMQALAQLRVTPHACRVASRREQ